VTAETSKVVMMPVSPYGQPLEGCTVKGFKLVSHGAASAKELKDRFDGLAAQGIPFGEYRVSVECGDITLNQYLMVDRKKYFEVIPQFIGMSHEGSSPELVIKMDPDRKSTITYWVQVLGVYNGFRSSGEFSGQTGESRVTAPPSGSYLVLVLSAGGYQCIKQIDLVEFTRRWVFHSGSCTVEPDQFAHLVSEEDILNHRSGEWYIDMEKRWDIFFRQIRDAGEKQD
jgi:hypothetical protein